MATEGRCIHPVIIERVRTTVSLEDIRHDIDALDDQIVALLAQRQRHVRRAAPYRIRPGQALAVDWRAEMMNRLHAQAVTQGAAPEVVARVYSVMIDAFLELEHLELASRSETRAQPVGDRRTR